MHSAPHSSRFHVAQKDFPPNLFEPCHIANFGEQLDVLLKIVEGLLIVTLSQAVYYSCLC